MKFCNGNAKKEFLSVESNFIDGKGNSLRLSLRVKVKFHPTILSVLELVEKSEF